jgi:hypothetical protein
MITERVVEMKVLRPAALLTARDAARVLAGLQGQDVSTGGVWNATTTLWQRYSQPWNGAHGARGDAQLVGSIGVMYDAPARHQITLYRVTLTEIGSLLGWSASTLCNDALAFVGRTLDQCPRGELATIPGGDPFRRVPVAV